MLIKKTTLIIFLITSLFAFTECRETESKKEKKEKKEDKAGKKEEDKQETALYTSPPGYDLNKPSKYNLRTELDEISGLEYYPKDTSVFAISDDKGSLYKIHLTGQFQIERWKFSKGKDFEDIVLHDSIFYVLSSKGEVNAFKFKLANEIVLDNYKLDVQGKNEFEILYFDKTSDKLVMICKDCEADPKQAVTAFSFNPHSRTFSDTPYFTINASDIAEKMSEDKVKFKPSAANIHPITHELFIISSVNKALVVADSIGQIKSVYPLDPNIYKQPEGLTFTPTGDLIISNEAAEVGPANILIFKYQSTVK
jgi:uncharacterized protein YjiK